MARIFTSARRVFTLSQYFHQSKQFSLVSKRLMLDSSTIQLPNIPKRLYSYEGDGKTVAFVTNKKSSSVLGIDSIHVQGFILVSGDELFGSVMLFPHSVLSWHVESASEINEESLVLFKLLTPKIDILVIGYGEKEAYTTEIRRNIAESCRKLDIRYEALPTEQACGLFNFLSVDRRYVAGAFIPPKTIDPLKLVRKKSSYSEDDDDEEDEDKNDDLDKLIKDSTDKVLLPKSDESPKAVK